MVALQSINTAFEAGSRINASNSLNEHVFKFSIGFNLSDIWFVK